MAKKFNYKLPSMVALTLFGTAFTAHHADAAEATQDQTKNKNVLDDQTTLKQANNAKKEVSNPTQNISGTQTYQDPTKVKPVQTTSTEDNDTSKQNDTADVTNITNTTSDSTNSDKESKQNDTDNQKDVSTDATDNQSTTNVDSDKSTNENNEAVKEQTDNNTNAQAQQQTQNTDNNVKNKTSQETSQNENTESTNQSTKQTVKNNGGYSLIDDEDDVESENVSDNNSNDTTKQTVTTAQSESNKTDKSAISNQTTKSTNTNTNTTNTKNDTKESAKVESAQVNDSSNNQVSTFRSVAKPRMMYATAKKATSSLPKYKPAVKSSINDYIRKKNFKAPQIEEDYSSYFPKYGYRNGVGKPEGIVVHDTANENSTITGEINYMKNNYNSAFVHAFVDGNRIIETAPTDYLSWGAGPYGNERYINVEIVHTHDYDSFARSMNNYADYAATQLQYYGLKPNSAENDGSGTVWTHSAISRWLGGTDHADPHGYFKQHNYSYNELYDLINEKYQIKMGQVAPWGTTSTSTTKPSSGSTTTKPTTKPSTSNSKLTVAANSGMAQINTKNSGLYTTVYDKKGHSTKEVQKALSVTKTATLGNDKFYLVQDYNTGEKFGWVKQNEVIYNTAKSPVKVNQSYNVKSGTKAYTVPWGTSKQVAGTVSGKGNQTFKATKQQQIDKSTYLYGTVNGLTGWISKAYLTTPTNTTKPATKPTTKPTTTNNKLTVAANNGVAQINSKNSGLYTTVYDKSGKTTKEVQKTLAVSKTATLGNDKFYLVQDYNTGKTYGWVKQGDVVYNTAKSPTSVNHSYSVKPGTKAYTVPWGTYKQEAGTVSGNGNQTFKATKQQQIDKATYLYGTVNGITGWISKYYLSEPTSTKSTVAKPKMAFKSYAVTNEETPKTQTTAKTNITQTTKKIGQVKLNNSGIRSSVYDKTAKNGAKYANRTFTISKQRTEGNQTYVLLQNTVSNTPLGWVNINDINVQNLGNEAKETGKYKVNSNNNGLYSIAWGTKNQQLLPTSQLVNQTFNASKAIYVGNEKYLYGTVNNRTGWIAAKDLEQSNTNNPATPYNYTFVIKNNNGYYYDDPAAKNGYSLKTYYEKPFVVIKQKQQNGVTWYYGKLTNGKYAWVKANDLTKELVKYSNTGRTLNQMASIQSNLSYGPQVQRTPGVWSNATYYETKNAMDSNKLAKNPVSKYQFLRLDQPQYLSEATLNKLLKGKGVLENQGAAFSQAAKKYGLNEIYLISHALLETGNGQSQLAKGANITNGVVNTRSATKYHNVFGIGAYDYNALGEGLNFAKASGWNSVSKAIIGGAKFIGNSYVKAGQNTLYKMRWNPAHPGTHQYATDINWADSNAQVLKGLYDQIGEVGKFFDIPTFK